MIDPRNLHKALAHKRETEKCKHPSEAIRDLPGRSYCKICKQNVRPLLRDKPGYISGTTGQRIKMSSVFPVFPSASDA